MIFQGKTQVFHRGEYGLKEVSVIEYYWNMAFKNHILRTQTNAGYRSLADCNLQTNAGYRSLADCNLQTRAKGEEGILILRLLKGEGKTWKNSEIMS